ncbi:Lactose transport system permease protein LacG [Paenibacillus allorhizoplanae]|uniref:Lactose transport system permease protein LacG n=1 Tax=Paenibacillus allorhizoplanae TaxID=2905648 RepID=A0ABN8GYP4_9BACL|nr:carbohydrate ABC transporter permease [Paenibacillus allorhizoplanae]CAH1219610.1 Lactose transport system permease protein LacG [Paenibacillus allorhizoplanae]
MKISLSRKLFMTFVYIALTILCTAMVMPFIKVIAQSLSSAKAIETGTVWFWPIDFNLLNYRAVLSDSGIIRAFYNSTIITVVGTLINLVMTCLLAYPTSRKEFEHSKLILFMIMITLIFSAPLIPNFLLVKQLGMLDTLWAVMIPGAISSFNFFILRSFFKNLSEELMDAARIDGCGELGILMRMVLPLSKASLAAIGLFYAVGNWNNLQGPLVYLQSPDMITLQVKLYMMIVSDVTVVPDIPEMIQLSPEGIRMTTIVVATLPILLIYPFLQKYFIQGATLGSLKE